MSAASTSNRALGEAGSSAHPLGSMIRPSSLVTAAERYQPAGDLAVVSCYFNSHHYRSKLLAFERFQASLERSGIPLFVGECAFGSDRFQLPTSRTTFRFRSPDPVWQKERLLNLVIDFLPDRYTKVAWIDADVLFENPAWAVDASTTLDNVAVVQLFARSMRLRPGQTEYCGDGVRERSFGAVRSVLPALARFGDYALHGHTGFAWAARREVVAKVGLYDAAIAGSGDHLMAHAFSGDFCSPCLEYTFRSCQGFLEHFRDWAERAYGLVGGRVGCIPGGLLHLWHGEDRRRRYRERNADMDRLGFDPERHLRPAPNGLWAWTDEAGTAFAQWTRQYFDHRAEDSSESSVPDDQRTLAVTR